MGEHELAANLRQKTLDLIMKNSFIAEYYNSRTGAIPRRAALAFGWTAAVFIDLAIQASRQEEVPEGEIRSREPGLAGVTRP